MAQDVVRAGRLFDPVRVDSRASLRHPRDGLGHFPSLVRVDRDRDVRADRVARDRQATHIVVEIAPTLSLMSGKPSATASTESRASFSSVAQPPGGGGVRGVTLCEELRPRAPPDPAGPRAGSPAPRPRERVREVAEVDDVDDLLGGEAASSCHNGWPSRLARRSHKALSTAPQAMWITPFSGPSQRNCGSPVSSRPNGPRFADVVDIAAHQAAARALMAGSLDVVAATGGEGEAVALESVPGVGARPRRRRRSSPARGSSRPSRPGPPRWGTGCLGSPS